MIKNSPQELNAKLAKAAGDMRTKTRRSKYIYSNDCSKELLLIINYTEFN